MVLFKRFVEIGRVVLISYGPDAGKVATIVDVIDQNRVLLDGPEKLTGVHRHELNIKRITLTDLKVAAKHNASHKCATALSNAFRCTHEIASLHPTRRAAPLALPYSARARQTLGALV